MPHVLLYRENIMAPPVTVVGVFDSQYEAEQKRDELLGNVHPDYKRYFHIYPCEDNHQALARYRVYRHNGQKVAMLVAIHPPGSKFRPRAYKPGNDTYMDYQHVDAYSAQGAIDAATHI